MEDSSITYGSRSCTEFTETIFIPHGLKLALDHLSIINPCLEAIRNLAGTFALITDIYVMPLIEFISNPAPVLLKLF